MRPEFYTGKGGAYNAPPDVSWFDADGEKIDWEETEYAFSMRLEGAKTEILADRDDSDFFIMFNGGAKDIQFQVAAPCVNSKWHRIIDTALPSPYDISPPGCEKTPPETGPVYKVKGHSIAVLFSYAERADKP
jgi:glycogen operon protein